VPPVAFSSGGTAITIGVVVLRIVIARIGVAAVGPPTCTASTAKLNDPAVVGVPLKTPDVGFSVNPGGSDPYETDQLTAPVAPTTVNVSAGYARFTTPAGSGGTVIGPKPVVSPTVRDSSPVVAVIGSEESVTDTVNE
jgi:hypothetical protein